MKKFEFRLEGVKRYKDQMLDLVMMEYAAAEQEVYQQQAKIDGLKELFRSFNEELKQKYAKGLNITELNHNKQYLLSLQDTIESEIIIKAKLEKKAETVRQRMVAAKVESASLETLKDQKLEEYKTAVQKSEDAFIEEFVSSKLYREQ